MYSKEGRPSIPPERLLKAALLMALFSVRSERQVCEQLNYNFMFRWFLDMTVNEAVFDDSVFAKNKERLLKADVAGAFFNGIVQQARDCGLLSQDHFTVEGTLIEAWASQKSFQKKDKPEDDTPPGDASRPFKLCGRTALNESGAEWWGTAARKHNGYREFSQSSSDLSFCQTGRRWTSAEKPKPASQVRSAASFVRRVISA